MTNKLVAIINSLKVPKIKKILLYEMKFLVPNYSCLQNPWLGGYSPQIPVLCVLCPQLNLLNPPPPNKIPGYATEGKRHYLPTLFYFNLLCREQNFTQKLQIVIVHNKHSKIPQTACDLCTWIAKCTEVDGGICKHLLWSSTNLSFKH